MSEHFLVTCGYSKTVRDAIVAILIDEKLAEQVRVFVVSDSSNHEDDADARRMVYELNQRGGADRVGCGQGEVLASLVCSGAGSANNRHDALSVILGAEFYSDNCVVHARMDDKPIGQLRGLIAAAPPDIIFAAES